MTKHRRTGQSRAFFILVAVGLMVFLEFVVFPDKKPVPIEMDSGPAISIEEAPAPPPEPAAQPAAPPAIMGPHGAVLDFESERDEQAVTQPRPPMPALQEPLWKRNAVTAPAVPEGAGKIVIIIDDLGVDRKRSREILGLPGPLTAAFLPYANDVGAMAEEARARGHEIMIHMPMEPTDPKLDTGPVALKTEMDAATFDAMLAKAFGALDHYVGMNNHMGSRLTQDRGAMNRLMNELGKRGLLFVDSRTIGSSVAEGVAALHGVPHAGRDVFLDHTPTYEGVVERLAAVEAVARRNGVAVAIGHPKDATIKALAEWLPTLAAKNLVLVPVSAVVKTEKAEIIADIPADEDEAAAHAPPPQTETPAVILPAPDEWMALPPL